MKTLLITAFAAVFALQVHGQLKPMLLGMFEDFTSQKSIRTIECDRIDDMASIDKLNSLPMIDSLVYVNTDNSMGSLAETVFLFKYKNGKITELSETGRYPFHIDVFQYKYNTDGNLMHIEERKLYTIDNSSWIVTQHDLEYTGSALQKITSLYGTWGKVVKEINVYGKVSKITKYELTDITSTLIMNHDDEGRLIHIHESGFQNEWDNSQQIGKKEYEYTTEISYVEPSATNNFKVREIIEKRLRSRTNEKLADGVDWEEKYHSTEYRNNDSLWQETTVDVSNTDGVTRYSYSTLCKLYYENDLLVKQVELSSDSIGRKINVYHDCRFEYESGNIARIVWGDLQKSNTYFKVYYAKTPHANNITLSNNQIITVDFNYELETSTDFPSLIDIKASEIKSSGNELAISKVYTSTGNAKQLVIELSRPIVKGESFEIIATAELPLQDGRSVPLSVVVQAQTATSDTEAVVSSLEIAQTANGINISSGSKIVNVRIFSAIGVLVFSANPQATDFTLPAQDLPSGIYQISAIDADGNSASQTVSF